MGMAEAAVVLMRELGYSDVKLEVSEGVVTSEGYRSD